MFAICRDESVGSSALAAWGGRRAVRRAGGAAQTTRITHEVTNKRLKRVLSPIFSQHGISQL